MSFVSIPFAAGEAHLNWFGLCAALEAGHKLPKAEIVDSFLYRGNKTLLNRAAWIDGMGAAVKTATVFPDNQRQNIPTVNGALSLYSDSDGTLIALVDFHLVTKWKTAGDSLFAATMLARKDSKKILIVGAGTVGRSLFEAYSAAFPAAQFSIWSRTSVHAEAMAMDYPGLEVAGNLESAVKESDIVSSATMSTDPVIRGAWLQPGQHIDLVGAYRADMREVDDEALARSRIFVDSYDTTVDHIGELKIPLKSGAIDREAVLADFYTSQRFERKSDEEITLFKNGGGAHLDLMTANYILQMWKAKG